MIVEIEEDSRDFTTVYKKNYLGEKGERPIGFRPLPKYRSPLNILNAPYKQYLNTRLENQSLPEHERSEEDPLDTLNKIRDKFPRFKNFLPEPDENVIENERQKLKKTIYHSDYSRDIDYARLDATLPQDWVIPETIQKRAYRSPWVFVSRDLIKSSKKIVKPFNNLDPNPEEREILRVTTGKSEYANTIGITGEKIMVKSPLNMKECIASQKSLRDPVITDSECSLILKRNLALPSKIF